jgi:hypothetical protein
MRSAGRPCRYRTLQWKSAQGLGSGRTGLHNCLMQSGQVLDESFLRSLVSVGTLVGLVLGYMLGWIHALWVRARSDYVRTRKSVPTLRSAKWGIWWRMVQRGAFAAVVVIALLAWVLNTGTTQLGR